MSPLQYFFCNMLMYKYSLIVSNIISMLLFSALISWLMIIKLDPPVMKLITYSITCLSYLSIAVFFVGLIAALKQWKLGLKIYTIAVLILPLPKITFVLAIQLTEKLFYIAFASFGAGLCLFIVQSFVAYRYYRAIKAAELHQQKQRLLDEEVRRVSRLTVCSNCQTYI